MRLFLTEDGTAGYALHGTDLVSVFSESGSGQGDAIVRSAASAGADRADCYAIPRFDGDKVGFLPSFYRSGGLVEVARVDINPAYEYPTGSMWVSVLAKIDNPPPVKHFDKDGYDDALAYRDSLLENQS